MKAAKLNVIGVSALAVMGMSACRSEQFPPTPPPPPPPPLPVNPSYSISSASCEAGCASGCDVPAQGSVTINLVGATGGTCTANFIYPNAVNFDDGTPFVVTCMASATGNIAGNTLSLAAAPCTTGTFFDDTSLVTGGFMKIFVQCSTPNNAVPIVYFADAPCGE